MTQDNRSIDYEKLLISAVLNDADTLFGGIVTGINLEGASLGGAQNNKDCAGDASA